jgi:hypothetical protein
VKEEAAFSPAAGLCALARWRGVVGALKCIGGGRERAFRAV